MYAKPSKRQPWEFFILGSGSTGNATVVRPPYTRVNINGEEKDICEAVLCDCGVTKISDFLYKYSNWGAINYQPKLTILITHAHSDHVKNLKQVCKWADPVIYCTKETYERIKPHTNNCKVVVCEYGEFYQTYTLAVMPLKADHDKEGSCHWVMSNGNKTVFYGCDTCSLSNDALEVIADCDLSFIECNYDEEWMECDHDPLNKSSVNTYIYPEDLKERIQKYGHCSNQYLSSLVETNRLDLRRCILMHLSRVYNSPEVLSKRLCGAMVGCPSLELPIRMYVLKNNGQIKDLSIDAQKKFKKLFEE